MYQKDLKKIAAKCAKERIYFMSDVFQREEVKKALIDMFVCGNLYTKRKENNFYYIKKK